jgi:uncharacterized protein YegL
VTSLEGVEFAINPDPRCACVLLLDTSGSMQGARISELNAGLTVLKQSLMDDAMARRRVEIAIVTFDSNVAIACDFTTPDQFQPPELTAQNATHMGAAITQGLDMIEGRKAVYKRNGIKYYRPWLFLITDGVPQGESPDVIAEAKRRVQADTGDKRVVVYAVGVGEDADLAKIQDITNSTPLRMRGLAFREMFIWLSGSMQRVSSSNVGDQVALAPVNNWGGV